MDANLAQQLLAAMEPLKVFGFHDFHLAQEPKLLQYSVSAKNKDIELTFKTDYGDFLMYALFIRPKNIPGAISDIAPLGAAIWDSVELKSLEFKRVSIMEMPRYVAGYVQALARHAGDILSGNYERVRRLQAEHHRRYSARSRAAGQNDLALPADIQKAVDELD